jgi:hypothetical protein
MGIVKRTIADELIDPAPDRNVNRIFIFETPKGGIGIHYRNLKFILSKPENIEEFKNTFRLAREEFENRKEKLDYDI